MKKIMLISALVAYALAINGAPKHRLAEVLARAETESEGIWVPCGSCGSSSSCVLPDVESPNLDFCDCDLVIPIPNGSGASQSTVFNQITNTQTG
jgi:hypothetical protein